MGIHVSFLFKSDLSKSPIADKILEINTVITMLPHMMIPPIVGVPAFFAWSAWKSFAFSPEIAFSFICWPNWCFVTKVVNGFARTNVIMNARNADPKISVKSRIKSCMVMMC